MVPSRNQLAPHCVSSQPVKSKYCHLTLKDLLSILVGITIPVAIGIYGAVTTDQAQKAARLAAEEQQRMAADRRAFDIDRADQIYQQRLYKDFLDTIYEFHKGGELNHSANPWAFANARYRAVHREFDAVRKVQVLLFLKEKQLIGRRTCITGCEVRDVEDIIRLNGMSFDNVDLSSETGGLNALNLSCIHFDGITMVNSSFSQANMNGVTFSNSRLNGSKFRGISFNCTRFENTEMGGVDFGGSNLSGAVFVNSDLSKTNLTPEQRKQAYFENVKMADGTIMNSKTTTTTETTRTSSTTSGAAKVPISTTILTTTEPLTTMSTTAVPTTILRTSTIIATTMKRAATTTRSTITEALPIIPVNATWSQNGSTVVGGLESPLGLCIDEDQKILIVEFGIHRITEYNLTGGEGKVVAGGNGSGSGLDQLDGPRNVIVDIETNSLIISDYGNQRVVRWSREDNTQQGEILLNNIHCWGLALDERRNLYVSDTIKQEVRRYRMGEKNGTLVAGGNGMGDALNQLHDPFNLLVDREQNVYVSDNKNHRVTKWSRDATEGVTIAGGHGIGDFRNQTSYPDGIVIDHLGTLYVLENDNHRVTRWSAGAQQGVVIAGGNGPGFGLNQLNHPFGLANDRHGNLYVVDTNNGRIQRFSIQ